MRTILSKISSSLFILIIICFFLPFVSVSCDNKAVMELTGIQLVTGTDLKTDVPWWREEQRIPPQIPGIIPLGLAVAGLFLGFIKLGRVATGLKALFGAIGALSLFYLKAKLASDVLKLPKMVFVIDYLPCYWIALTLLVTVAVINLASFFWKRKADQVGIN